MRTWLAGRVWIKSLLILSKSGFKVWAFSSNHACLNSESNVGVGPTAQPPAAGECLQWGTDLSLTPSQDKLWFKKHHVAMVLQACRWGSGSWDANWVDIQLLSGRFLFDKKNTGSVQAQLLPVLLCFPKSYVFHPSRKSLSGLLENFYLGRVVYCGSGNNQSSILTTRNTDSWH